MENYHDKKTAKNIVTLREMLKEMPSFLRDYFRSLNDRTSSLTRLGYAYDLKIFFTFMAEEVLYGKNIADITLEDMSKVEAEDIEAFMEHLSYYVTPSKDDDTTSKEIKKEIKRQNKGEGKSRKLAAVRRLFRFLFMRKKIHSNPADLIEFPKLHEKPIITLEPDEVSKMLDEVDSGENLTPRQKQYHDSSRLRDIAIITLLLGTGIRLSECVGLDINDILFTINGMRIIRKGGDEVILYFGDEVQTALQNYLEVRETVTAKEGHENALFLSLQNKRLTGRAIQNLVKKYAPNKLKNISPHKLRSTFGTQLYAETRDIYLVANVLGHEDVNTTRKHYAKMDEAARRKAANVVRLRD